MNTDDPSSIVFSDYDYPAPFRQIENPDNPDIEPILAVSHPRYDDTLFILSYWHGKNEYAVHTYNKTTFAYTNGSYFPYHDLSSALLELADRIREARPTPRERLHKWHTEFYRRY